MRALNVLILSLGIIVSTSAAAQLPKPEAAIPIGGPGGWDLLTVDTLSHRLYVSHSSHVIVIGLDENKVLGEIPNTPRVHGIAIAQELNRGFTSNGGDTSVTVFDLKTDSIITNIKVSGVNPDVILYDPYSHRVFVFNGRSSDATVIDAQSLKIVGSVPLDGKPELAVTDLNGHVYVNLEDKSMVAVIDPQTLKVVARWPLAPCEEPTGLALDRVNGRLFAAGANKLMSVMDAKSGRIIATIPIGEGVDGAAFDPATHLVFSPNGEGTITVIRQESPDKYSVAGTINTTKGARTMTLDERTHRLYLPVGSRPDSSGVAKEDFRVLVYQE
jgi:DNA-binding beta-propeller fold protein YncE